MNNFAKSDNKVEGDTLLNLNLWPNRSLSKKEFSTTIFYTAVGMIIPVIPFLGDRILFAILPFSMTTLLLLVFLVKMNYKREN